MKNGLKFFLLIHIVSLCIINYDALTFLVEKKTKFNEVSDQIIPHLKKNKASKNIIKVIRTYENLLGGDKGFEFFSPNVDHSQKKMIFVGNDGNEIYLLNSIEGELKYLTFNSYLDVLLINSKSRDGILKNICADLFQKHQDINEVSIFIISETVSELYDKHVLHNEDRMLVAKIMKNE